MTLALRTAAVRWRVVFIGLFFALALAVGGAPAAEAHIRCDRVDHTHYHFCCHNDFYHWHSDVYYTGSDGFLYKTVTYHVHQHGSYVRGTCGPL